MDVVKPVASFYANDDLDQWTTLGYVLNIERNLLKQHTAQHVLEVGCGKKNIP